jgi:hypothetical protein
MTLAQALIALAEGKKVRQRDWLDRDFISLDGSELRDADGRWCGIYGNGDDWEPYEEPKKKITLTEWRVKLSENYIFTTMQWFTEAEAKEKWPDAKLTPLRSVEVEDV